MTTNNTLSIKYYNLLRQVDARVDFGTLEDMFQILCVHYLLGRLEEKYSVFPNISDDKIEKLNSDSVEYVQQAYKDGYAVILADGKVIGYEKEAPAV
jgi:hypothetical protein